jgi:hypothetical protein
MDEEQNLITFLKCYSFINLMGRPRTSTEQAIRYFCGGRSEGAVTLKNYTQRG